MYFCFKHKTAYEMRISDWSSDVCSSDLKVSMIKLDPYINVDAGTMSPFQHGEVFVTEDGAETDLDLGHYERFLRGKTTRYSNMTTGQIYRKVQIGRASCRERVCKYV